MGGCLAQFYHEIKEYGRWMPAELQTAQDRCDAAACSNKTELTGARLLDTIKVTHACNNTDYWAYLGGHPREGSHPKEATQKNRRVNKSSISSYL